MAEKKKKEEKKEEQKAMVLPDYLKGVQQDSSEMASGVGVSVPRISLKGFKFTFIEGEDKDINKDAQKMIILGVEPRDGMSKTFYAKKYDPNSSDPPDCSSWDGIRPDTWCSKPQSSICATCPNAEWGSAKSMTGKKAKACKESKRLIVVKADDIEGTQYVLTVTIASLKALAVYGKWLAQNQLPYSAVITTFDFREDAEFPELTFEFDSFLDEANGLACLAIAEARPWDQFKSKAPALPEGDKQQTVSQIAQNTKNQRRSDIPMPTQENATEEDVSKIVDNW